MKRKLKSPQRLQCALDGEVGASGSVEETLNAFLDGEADRPSDAQLKRAGIRFKEPLAGTMPPSRIRRLEVA
jgi:hypothetical protein